MTVYQELQLNQAGSKKLIRSCTDKKEKRKHIAIYCLKIALTVAFCVVFVSIFTGIFGAENGVAGVGVLLALLAFRQVDLGFWPSQSVWVMVGISMSLFDSGGSVTLRVINNGFAVLFVILFVPVVDWLLDQFSTHSRQRVQRMEVREK